MATFLKFYTLWEIVELIGKHLFGDQWTGREHHFRMPPVMSPDELLNRQAKLGEAIEVPEAELFDVRQLKLKTSDPKQIRILTARENKILRTMERTMRELGFPLPEIEPIATHFDHHHRLKTVHDMLLDAIRNHKLMVHDGEGNELNSLVWTVWLFRYHIDHSKTAAGTHWQPARIYETDFDPWIATVTPGVQAPKPVSNEGEAPKFFSVEDQCRAYLKNEVRLWQSGQPKTTKTAYRKSAKRMFPHLSLCQFNFIWVAEAPPEWKKAGRPQRSPEIDSPLNLS